MHIIGIAGKSGSGKNTVAAFLAAELNGHGYTVKLEAFAVPIKDFIRRETACPLVDREMARTRMQEIGSVMRDANPNYYISALIGRNNLDAHLWEYFADKWEPADFLIITDVRFKNEAEFCDRHGVVWLVRGNHLPLPAAAAAHESEQGLNILDDHVDCVIVNERGLGDLAEHIKTLIRDGQHLRNGIRPGRKG